MEPKQPTIQPANYILV